MANSFFDYRKNSCLNDSIDTALDAISQTISSLDDIESIEPNELTCLLFNKILQSVRYIKSAEELGFLSRNQLSNWKHIENKAVFVANFIEDFYHLKNVYPFTDNFVFYMKNRELMNEFFKELIRVTKKLVSKYKESI